MLGTTAGDFGSFRFSSEDLRPADRIPVYRDVLGRMVGKMDIEPADEKFSCKGYFYRVVDLRISHVASSAIRGTRHVRWPAEIRNSS